VNSLVKRILICNVCLIIFELEHVSFAELDISRGDKELTRNFGDEASWKSAIFNVKNRVDNLTEKVSRMKNNWNCFKIISTGRFWCLDVTLLLFRELITRLLQKFELLFFEPHIIRRDRLAKICWEEQVKGKGFNIDINI
jgi:hypothetical protein